MTSVRAQTRPFRVGCLILSLISPLPPAGIADERAKDDEATIVHVLNRLAYGPRPGDVERVRKLGLESWIETQLHPERIPEPDLARRLGALETLRLSPAELLAGYELPREVRREIQRKRAELGDGASEEEQQRLRREMRQRAAADMQGPPRRVLEDLQSAKLLRAVYGERQLEEVLVDFWMNHFNVYADKGPVKFLAGQYERDVIRPRVLGKFEDLLLATAKSPAMLFYLDNWLSVDPGADSQPRRGLADFMPSRRRPPEMGPERGGGEGPPPGGGQGRRRGLNENYAREIMELHTLGVDGGYTQKDVTEVARCFTGWTILGLRQQRPEFAFDERLHDKGSKLVLGERIESGGVKEGETVIHRLATHPSTARFISYKLARRFVADDPPESLVERASRTFRSTDGDIRAVVKAIVSSPEFLSPQARAVKVKTPLEFVVSAVRAAGAEVSDARELARRLGEMGMPLYLQQPPTGYKDTADAWVSTNGLLGRLNFALDLAGGRVRGTSLDAASLAAGASDSMTLAESLSARFVPSGLSESTRRTLAGGSGPSTSPSPGPSLSPSRMAGLILGSPEFQRR